MGRMNAEGIAEFSENRRAGLIYHLHHNHFPPVPSAWLDVAERVIDRLNAGGTGDEEIANPVRRDAEGVPETVTLGQVVEGLHLDPGLDPALHEVD